MLIEFTSLVQILEKFKSFSSFYVMYKEKEMLERCLALFN